MKATARDTFAAALDALVPQLQQDRSILAAILGGTPRADFDRWYDQERGRTFDATLAWGLFFILPADAQRSLIGKVARVLNSGGQFLFTSPREVCSWMDSMTGLPSISLGHEAYQQELVANGMALVGNDKDEGANYYYFATKL